MIPNIAEHEDEIDEQHHHDHEVGGDDGGEPA
jgi:hypothetical protein